MWKQSNKSFGSLFEKGTKTNCFIKVSYENVLTSNKKKNRRTNPVQHPEFVEKLIQNNKNVNKNLQTVLKDLAVFEGAKLRESNEKYFILHRKEADPTFINILLKEAGRNDIFQFLSVGDEKGAGNIVLYGNEKAISDLSSK